MAALHIRTKLNSVVVVGAFCGWDIDKAKRIDRKKGNALIHIENMPKGEYKVLSCKSLEFGEVYPTDGRPMPSRYFGEIDETINCYFEKE